MTADSFVSGPEAKPADAGARMLAVTAPYDGSVISEVSLANRTMVEEKLAAAAALHRDRGAWLSVAERIEILRRASAIMAQQAEALAIGAAREGGKPLIDSRIEVQRAIDCLHICIETLRTEPGHVIPMTVNAASAHRIAFTRKEPIGVVVAVSAFNHPLNLIVH